MDVLGGIINLVDGFVYTPEEKAADDLKRAEIDAKNRAAAAQAAESAAATQRTQMMLTYGLIAVGVIVGGVVLFKVLS